MKIEIDIARQRLRLFDTAGACVRDYEVSTALNGAGEQSGQTRGQHDRPGTFCREQEAARGITL